MRQGDKTFAVGVATGALAALVLGMAKPRAGDGDPKGRVKSTPAESAAGAGARSPSEMPAKGWAHVLKRAFAGFSGDRVMANAAAVTFYTLLALFPAIAAMISIYGLFADPGQLKQQADSLGGLIPGGGVDIIKGQIDALAGHGRTALSGGAVIGLIASIWSANAGVKAFFDALNAVYHETEKRSFVRLTLTSLAFTLGLVVFVLFAMLMVIVAPVVLKFAGLSSASNLLVRIGRWVALAIVVDVLLACLYRFGPSRKRARWRWVSWGATFATVLWLGASVLFSYYVAHFGSYNKTYGSLGAVVGFMTWIWISSMVVLMGGEINAELEQQTDRDTTEGPEKPMGARGAYKADVKA